MAKVTLSGGAFQDPSGAPLANGYLTMTLSHDSQVSSSEVFAAVPVTIPLDSSGNVSGTPMIWANDALSPANSYYLTQLFDSNGMMLWKSPQRWTITSSPNPFPIGNLVPTQPPTT